MGNFHSLPFSRKHHRVVANNITGPDSGKTDGLPITRTRLPLATVDGDFTQITTQCTGDYIPHTQCST